MRSDNTTEPDLRGRRQYNVTVVVSELVPPPWPAGAARLREDDYYAQANKGYPVQAALRKAVTEFNEHLAAQAAAWQAKAPRGQLVLAAAGAAGARLGQGAEPESWETALATAAAVRAAVLASVPRSAALRLSVPHKRANQPSRASQMTPIKMLLCLIAPLVFTQAMEAVSPGEERRIQDQIKRRRQREEEQLQVKWPRHAMIALSLP